MLWLKIEIVSRVFATRACNFPAIQFDTQLLVPNMNDASSRCLHQNFTSIWSLLNCCSTNWRPQTSEKSPIVFNIAVDWWQILQGRPDVTIFKEDFTWTSSYFFSMFSLTLETKVTRIHCTSSVKVGDFKLGTSEKQRLDWLDNSE